MDDLIQDWRATSGYHGYGFALPQAERERIEGMPDPTARIRAYREARGWEMRRRAAQAEREDEGRCLCNGAYNPACPYPSETSGYRRR